MFQIALLCTLNVSSLQFFVALIEIISPAYVPHNNLFSNIFDSITQNTIFSIKIKADFFFVSIFHFIIDSSALQLIRLLLSFNYITE